MAGILEISTPIPDPQLLLKPIDKPGDSGFKDIMDKISGGKKAPAVLKKLTDDAEAGSTAQSIIKKLMSSGATPDELRAELDALTPADRAEVLGILGQIMNALDSDSSGKTAQGLLNRLFHGADSASGANDSSDAALQNILDALALLKNDKTATSNSALMQMVAMLAAYENNPNLVTEDMLAQPEDGNVAIGIGDNMTTSLSTADLQAKLANLIAMMGSEKPEEPILPETPIGPVDPGMGVDPEQPTAPPGAGDIIPPPITPPGDVDNPPVVDPIVPPVTEEPPTDEVIDPPKGPADGEVKTDVPVATQVAAIAVNKQTAEANTSRIAASGRVKRSSELDVSAGTGVSPNSAPAQNVVPLATPEVAQTSMQAQILANIAQTLAAIKPGESREMTMTLNPGNLGEISIKMVHEAGQVVVTIAAQSESTQKLLADRLPALLQNLQTLNSDVKELRVENASTAQMMGFNLGSSAGQNAHDSAQQQQNAAHFSSQYAKTEDVPVATQKTPDFFKGGNKLWQTA